MTVLLFFSALQAYARISPAWIDSPAYAPNTKVLIHESSIKSAASSVSVQKHSASDVKVKNLLKDLAAPTNVIEEFLPQKCYRLKREGLTSRQTWCVKGADAYAFIEIGSQQMSENDFTELVLGTLTGKR